MQWLYYPRLTQQPGLFVSRGRCCDECLPHIRHWLTYCVRHKGTTVTPTTASHVGQTDQIDHDLDHLVPHNAVLRACSGFAWHRSNPGSMCEIIQIIQLLPGNMSYVDRTRSRVDLPSKVNIYIMQWEPIICPMCAMLDWV